MIRKQGREAAMPEALAAGAGKFSHLMQADEQRAAANDRKEPAAVAAKIIEAGKKRRGEIQ